MKAEEKGQGELFGQRTKRSRMADPGGVRGKPTSETPSERRRRGAEYVADAATTAAAEKRRQLAEQLERIALDVGYGMGATGFALWHVRGAAETIGVLSGQEGTINPRELSWLGALLPGMARRGLVEKVTIDGRVQYDTSEGGKAHGNKNVLWRLTADGRTTAQFLSDTVKRIDP